MKQKICLSIIFFISFAFAEKYLSRITDYSLIWAIGLTLNYLLIWQYKRQVGDKLASFRNIEYCLLAGYVLVAAFVFYQIPQETLNVDRWSVIASFWQNFFDGKYAYFATSHMGNQPGPMPFYFILALPFYVMGEYGFFSLLAIPAFIFIIRWQKIRRETGLPLFLLFIFSIPVMYEIVCRSNLALNSILVLISIIYLLEPKRNVTDLMLSGILIGLFLSIRNVFVIAYIIAAVFALRSGILSFYQLLSIGVVAIFTFALTFIPFVIGHFDDFLVMNPFIIQSNVLLPFALSATCIGVSAVSSFLVRRTTDVWFYSGLMLFLTAVLHIIYKIITESFDAAFYHSRADLTYMIFCIPFLLFYLMNGVKADFPASTRSSG